ncbi:MAG: DUF983 domain-containing protein [Chitinophagaceae bacterium]
MAGHSPNYFLSSIDNRCPRCRTGKLFMSSNAYDLKNTVKMNEHCPVCGQPTEIETGFYYGTGYVSYALTVGFSILTFILWWLIFGFSLDDTRFFWWMGINAVVMIIMQPLFMRLSRSLWLSWFVKYDPDWKTNKIETTERVVKEHQHNW